MSEIPFNRLTPDPTMKQLLDLFRRDLMLAFNCHALGTIQSFDASNQTASISINYTKTFLEAGQDGVYRQVQQNYPTIVDCPVIVLQGGGGALTFPIAKGDSCLVMFNDRDMDNWLESGQVGPVNTQRLHSFADGIALVGIRSFNNSLDDYDEDRVVLRKDSTQVALGSKIEISNDIASLGPALAQLMATLNTLVTASASWVTVADVKASVAAMGTDLTEVTVKLMGLLE